MGLTTGALVAIIAVSVLLFSGNSIASSAHVGAPISVSTGSVGHAPTYTGPASKFLLSGPVVGPLRSDPSMTASSAKLTTGVSAHVSQAPSPNPRGELSQVAGVTGAVAAATAAGTLVVPPVVSCQPRGPACDAISGNSGGATTDPMALNSVDSGASFGVTVEPPDQGVCAGNGYVMEVLNIGELRVFNATFGSGTADITLDSLMGLTSMGWSSGGDVSCLYDYNNGGHWFVTEFVSRAPESAGGAFAACFAAVLDGCLEGIAVSVTNNPTGAYNVYFLDPNAVNSDPGVGYLLNDFAKIGNTHDALLLFYDEFNLNGSLIPACPAYGCFGFNGAQEFAINKNALELGWPVTEPFGGPNPFFNVAYENMGTDPNLQPPDGSCFSGATAGATCWYQVIPAQTPVPSQFDNWHHGTGFMLGSLDFFGAGDNRIATFDWTGLSALNSYACGACSGSNGIHFGGQVLTGLEAYRDEGAGCPASTGGFCGLAAQKAGTIPLGANCVAFGLASGVSSCPESGIATNGDGFTQVSYSQGNIWGAVSTLIKQRYGTGTCPGSATCEIHVGAAYWAIGTGNFNTQSHGSFTVTSQGYVTARHEDIEFPSIAASGTGPQAVIAFSLSGNGGPTGADSGGFYPSSAYGWLSTTSGGIVGGVIHISDRGRSPQDGFTQYLGYPGGIRPRWGDYTEAIYSPAMGGGFYFATEYIQSPNCSPAAFLKDPSCGGTRMPYANWGSSLNWVP